MPVVVLGLSHHSAPVELREKFAFPGHSVVSCLNELRQAGLVEEAVILSTCNRVEIYASADQERGETLCKALQDFMLQNRGYEGQAPHGSFYSMVEPHSIEHLFKVASGLDSMILGETEILGQLKQAYNLSLQEKHTGRRLNKIFQKAFNISKQIRSETNIQRGSTSVGSVAVELAEKIFSDLRDRRVMVVGAGDTSEKTARSLVSRGAQSIMVANRTYDKAIELAERLNGRAIKFDHWMDEFPSVDIVISSTAAPHYIIVPETLEKVMTLRENLPLLLIDIAVPRDIDPQVNFMENVYLYDIDDLQGIAEDYLSQRKDELDLCKQMICEATAGLLRQLPSEGGSSGYILRTET